MDLDGTGFLTAAAFEDGGSSVLSQLAATAGGVTRVEAAAPERGLPAEERVGEGVEEEDRVATLRRREDAKVDVTRRYFFGNTREKRLAFLKHYDVYVPASERFEKVGDARPSPLSVASPPGCCAVRVAKHHLSRNIVLSARVSVCVRMRCAQCSCFCLCAYAHTPEV